VNINQNNGRKHHYHVFLWIFSLDVRRTVGFLKEKKNKENNKIKKKLLKIFLLFF
jgi:hypothetical protein